MKIIHIADIHADSNPAHQAKLCRSFDQVAEHVSLGQTNYIVIPGDVWENLQNFKEDSGVEIIYKYFRLLSPLVKAIVIVRGNANHDPNGSIALLDKLEPNIYAYEYPLSLAFYADKNEGVDLLRSGAETLTAAKPEIIFNMVPYPTKAMVLKDLSIDQNNQSFTDVFSGLMELMGVINNQFICPKVMGFHGQVGGAQFSNGQEGKVQDIIIPQTTLRKANANYYALGHIHLPQMLAPDMGYSGSMYNKNWGETEQKYFYEIEFYDAPFTPVVNKIPLLAARPMVTVEAEFKDGKFVYENHIPENAEVRFRYKINEDERNLMSEDKLDEIKNIFGSDVQFDKNVIPVQRETRSENIMHAETTEQEVEEYAKVVNKEMTKSIRKKIADIEAELANSITEEEALEEEL